MSTDRTWADRLAGHRIVVTGAHGVIGSHLVRRLTAAVADVLSIDNTPATTGHHPPALGHGRLRTVLCDIRSPHLPDVIAAHHPDTVVHLAAQVGVPDSMAQPSLDADVNIRGTIAVAEAAAAAGAGMVFASTCAIYGHPAQLPAAEDSPLAPISPYGLSKATAVQYLDWFSAHRDLPVTTLILGNVYGTGTPKAVIDRFVAAATTSTPTILHGHGEATRDFVHIDDVTNASLAACTAAGAGRINISSGTETSIRDLHSLIASLTAPAIAVQHRPARPGDIARMRLNVARAATELGWHARTDLPTGVAALLRSAQPHTRTA